MGMDKTDSFTEATYFYSKDNTRRHCLHCFWSTLAGHTSVQQSIFQTQWDWHTRCHRHYGDTLHKLWPNKDPSTEKKLTQIPPLIKKLFASIEQKIWLGRGEAKWVMALPHKQRLVFSSPEPPQKTVMITLIITAVLIQWDGGERQEHPQKVSSQLALHTRWWTIRYHFLNKVEGKGPP